MGSMYCSTERCIIRRELIGHLCSDNGCIFIETSKELKALFKYAEF